MTKDNANALPSPDSNSQKFILFSAIGYLHCLRAGKCEIDEIYCVLGQPLILDGLRAARVSERMLETINGLDEPGWCRQSMGDRWFEDTVAELLGECFRALKELGPPSGATPPPTLKLFPNGGLGS
jgi:hypothetical protein